MVFNSDDDDDDGNEYLTIDEYTSFSEDSDSDHDSEEIPELTSSFEDEYVIR